MSTGISRHSRNGATSASRSWKHVRIERRTAGHCRVTFDHPPMNAVTAATVDELTELVGLIEQDRDLKVVVFDSANPDFYLTDDYLPDAGAEISASGRDVIQTRAWRDALARLARAPVVSIAAIRGRTRGAGSRFLLACDMRLASRGNTSLGPPDTGGDVTGLDGSASLLANLVGSARALEILLCATDLEESLAETYGYVNRTVTGDRLDQEVAVMAARVERFDRDTIARAKHWLNPVTLRSE